MGYPSPVEVDPAALRAVGSQVAETADALRTASDRHAGALPVAGGAGWAAVAAARAAGTAWAAFLPRLAGQVDGLAGDLRETATAYEQSDQAAAGRLGGPR
ncbi:type VII secretion target [Actinoplanes sp. NPDC049668]|uniref:type VII secretion target n=1 Tax=unclassified Actinoplanes TaxID=2626549 RepID=UPI0033A3570C